MNKQLHKEQLDDLQDEIQEYWSRLTNNDLEAIGDERAKLEQSLQEEYRYTKKQARAEVDKFLNQIESQADVVRSTVENRVRQTQKQLKEQMEGARESVEEAAVDYNRQVRQAAPPEVEQAVEQYPWLVVIGAFVVGLLIGVTLSQGKK